MKIIEMCYLAHFNDCTGKPKEQLQLDVQTVNDLIDALENLYPGVADLLRRENGKSVPQNAIVLNRSGCRAKFIADFSVELMDNDSITLI